MKALALLIVTSSLLVLACSDDDTAGSAAGQAAVCRGVTETRASLNDVLENAVPLNEAALQDSLQDARADIDTLAVSVEEAQAAALPRASNSWRRTFRASSG